MEDFWKESGVRTIVHPSYHEHVVVGNIWPFRLLYSESMFSQIHVEKYQDQLKLMNCPFPLPRV